MEHKTFSLRLPLDLTNALDQAAQRRFRKQNARNQMIYEILSEWYELKIRQQQEQTPALPSPAGAVRQGSDAGVTNQPSPTEHAMIMHTHTPSASGEIVAA